MLEHKKEEEVERAGPVFDPPVYIQRYTTVRDILYKLPGIEKVVDFGCADGKFMKYLKKLPFAKEIVGIDISDACLEEASYRSRPVAWDFLFKRHHSLSIKFFKGDIAEKDCHFQGFDAVTCIELIEHLSPAALQKLPDNVFGYIHPKVAVFTTPNSEFNVLFPQLEGFRHWDHKFEWDRSQFSEWCSSIIADYPEYSVEMKGIGNAPLDYSHLGCCTQMAVFTYTGSTECLTQHPCISDAPYILVDENEYPGREENRLQHLNDDLEDNCSSQAENSEH